MCLISGSCFSVDYALLHALITVKTAKAVGCLPKYGNGCVTQLRQRVCSEFIPNWVPARCSPGSRQLRQ